MQTLQKMEGKILETLRQKHFVFLKYGDFDKLTHNVLHTSLVSDYFDHFVNKTKFAPHAEEIQVKVSRLKLAKFENEIKKFRPQNFKEIGVKGYKITYPKNAEKFVEVRNSKRWNEKYTVSLTLSSGEATVPKEIPDKC
ncbi:hypothetical protein L596_013428 [Steinernema carpocapsae]|uniref:Uncharacterized protein n=1 Tax=Steinernema carpocapsae TaxID=34508 RepID=A0A4U5P097_STECR|nr:hypothetical protein L596_013428 [Steinernema carpocapsae]